MIRFDIMRPWQPNGAAAWGRWRRQADATFGADRAQPRRLTAGPLRQLRSRRRRCRSPQELSHAGRSPPDRTGASSGTAPTRGDERPVAYLTTILRQQHRCVPVPAGDGAPGPSRTVCRRAQEQPSKPVAFARRRATRARPQSRPEAPCNAVAWLALPDAFAMLRAGTVQGARRRAITRSCRDRARRPRGRPCRR